MAEVNSAKADAPNTRSKYGWIFPAALVAFAALSLKFFAAPAPDSSEGPVDGVALEVHRLTEQGKNEPLLDGTTGRPGDELGIRIRLAHPAHALVLAVPPVGVAFSIWPPKIKDSEPLPESSGSQSLDDAMILPDGVGSWRLIALACQSPLPVAQPLAEASQLGAGPVRQLDPDCAQSVVTLRQIAAPR